MQPRRVASAAAVLAEPSRATIVLALDAGVTPQTASTHLKKLAGADVAQVIEALSAVGVKQIPAAARELRFARCCYDHLAGQLGVAVTERLLRPGNTVLHDLGIDLAALEASRRPLFRCCTDWTERRAHVAGALGAALLRRYTDEGWLARVSDSRKLVVTPRGKELFVELIGVDAAIFSRS